MLMIVVAGSYLLVVGHATSPYGSQEAEGGTLGGNASLVTDSGASASRAVKFGSVVSTVTTCQSVAIPAYFYPTSGSGNPWAVSTGATPGVGIMIANPNSGPGTSVDSSYATVISNAKNAGIKVFGYVDTAYAGYSAASVEANVNA